MRRPLAFVIVLLLASARAEAVSVRDLIELSHAGLSDDILIALIDVDHSVFSLDTDTLKQLKQSGVSETVILAMIRSGRTPASQEEAARLPEQVPPAPAPDPTPEALSSNAAPAPPVFVPVVVPVAVPVLVPARHERPRCTKVAPVYWGFGGKLRPNSWEPPPTFVCR